MSRPAQSGTEDLDFRSYFQRLGSVALLTADEEKTLGWNIQNDGCASSRDRLACANLRLVVSIARRFMGRGLGMPDLIAEGNLGLLRAVDRFDPAHGAR
ncbi:MAG: sigma factor, partial [Phycisphaerae bacterium]